MESVRIQIPHELFAPAESSHFEGTMAADVLKAGPDLYSFAEPLAWQVDITNTGDALLVTGTVEGQATTSCARCLAPVELPLTGEIEGYFLTGGEDAKAPDDLDEDEFDHLPEDGAINLTELVCAALLVEVPFVPLCDEECKGLCLTCGANLNEGPCGCAAPEQDPDFELAKNPFAALKGYSFEDSEQG